MTNFLIFANSSWIRAIGRSSWGSLLPKGPKKKRSTRQKRKRRAEYAERNHIEERIGNAKQALSLNKIKAKLQNSSETWIAVTLFVLNLSVFAAKPGMTF